MEQKKVFIIAEAGVNHNGKLSLAKELVDKAKWAGADAIKFQTYISENMVSRYAEKAEYQKKSTDQAENQLAMLKEMELSFSEFEELNTYCREQGILFLSTPFDEKSLHFLDKIIDVPLFKIPSGEITNKPYLEQVKKCQKPVILSTGMSTIEETRNALEILGENMDVTLLHCTTEYPAPYESVNLNAMKTLKDIFHVKVGYSDHTKGIEIPIAAVALGAIVIEKHFTLDCNMEGPDHMASLEPQELKNMIEAIRNVEKALGDGSKRPMEIEIKNRAVARKSIVAARRIEKGEMFNDDNLAVKRPGIGISPMLWDEVIGQTAKRKFEKDELIEI